MKNIFQLILIIAALIILLPIVLKLTFSLLGIVVKIVFFVVLIALAWPLIQRLLRLL